MAEIYVYFGGSYTMEVLGRALLYLLHNDVCVKNEVGKIGISKFSVLTDMVNKFSVVHDDHKYSTFDRIPLVLSVRREFGNSPLPFVYKCKGFISLVADRLNRFRIYLRFVCCLWEEANLICDLVFASMKVIDVINFQSKIGGSSYGVKFGDADSLVSFREIDLLFGKTFGNAIWVSVLNSNCADVLIWNSCLHESPGTLAVERPSELVSLFDSQLVYSTNYERDQPAFDVY
jgi:hypothetical protein